MKKLTPFLVCLLFFQASLLDAVAEDKIAVLDFKSNTAPEELVPAVAEILRRERSGLGGYTVIERGMLEQILQEQALQMSGAVDSETAVKIGKRTGAGIVVTGVFGHNVVFSNSINIEPVRLLSFSLNNNGTRDATSVLFDDFYLSCDKMVHET